MSCSLEQMERTEGLASKVAPGYPGGSSLTTSEWLSTDEAADYLRLPKGSLFNLCSRGRLPHYKLGRKTVFLRSELRELLLANRKGGF